MVTSRIVQKMARNSNIVRHSFISPLVVSTLIPTALCYMGTIFTSAMLLGVKRTKDDEWTVKNIKNDAKMIFLPLGNIIYAFETIADFEKIINKP